MIGKLSGIIDSFGETYLLLDVGGVGYVVTCSSRTLAQGGQVGDSLSLLVDTHVREDAINLYGFRDSAEQHWFRLLTSVQGVGAKVALAILSACPPERIGFAIASGDKAALTQADGVGPKLGLRILTELKDKAARMEFSSPLTGAGAVHKTGAVSTAKGTQASVVASNTPEQDATSALVNLGYSRSDAYQAVLRAREILIGEKGDSDPAVSSLSSLITQALKELSA